MKIHTLYLLLISLICFAALSFSPIVAQSTTPAQPVSPEIQALKTQVNDLKKDVERLTKDVASLTGINQLGTTVLTIAITLLVGSLGSGYLIARFVSDRAKHLIDDAIYGVDPVHVPIRVPAHDFDLECQLIEARGFRTKPYKLLEDKSLVDCVVIIPIKTDDDVKNFEEFLDGKDKPDPTRVAYLLYSPSIRIKNDLFRRFPNMTFANIPGAIGTHLFALAHGMVVERPSND